MFAEASPLTFSAPRIVYLNVINWHAGEDALPERTSAHLHLILQLLTRSMGGERRAVQLSSQKTATTDFKVGHGSQLNEAPANDAIIQSKEEKTVSQ